MATGRLGTADLAAATDTTLYTCPTSTFAVVTVSICNRGATPRDIRLAICDTSTPGLDEYLEFDAQLVANGVVERTGLVVDAGKLVVVRSSGVDVTAICYGIETSTA